MSTKLYLQGQLVLREQSELAADGVSGGGPSAERHQRSPSQARTPRPRVLDCYGSVSRQACDLLWRTRRDPAWTRGHRSLRKHVSSASGKYLKNLLMREVKHFYSKKLKQEGSQQIKKKITYFFPLNLTPWRYLLLSSGYPSRIFLGHRHTGSMPWIFNKNGSVPNSLVCYLFLSPRSRQTLCFCPQSSAAHEGRSFWGASPGGGGAVLPFRSPPRTFRMFRVSPGNYL